MPRGGHRTTNAFPCIACALALFVVGCRDKTALVVEVSSPDLVVPDDVDALRFQATSSEGPMVTTTEVPLPGPWPQSLAIYPGTASSSSDVTITVTGTRAGAFAVRRVVRARFLAGQSSVVRVELTRACLGVECAAGVDCIAGMCMGVVDDGGVPDAGSADGGPTDGGATDGGATDGGATDGGGELDGGPFDGGGCTPMGVEVCGGGDEDCDGRVDESLPCPGALVISELATGGPAGGADEFVEIYNRTASPIRLDTVELEYRAATGATYSRRATCPVGSTISAHGYYLLGASGYTRTPAADPGGGWSTGFARDGGHVRLVAGATELDRIGWGTAIDPEGRAVARVADDAVQTYERKARPGSTTASMSAGGADETSGNGHDTDDNLLDLVVRDTADPQSSASPAETP